MKRHKLSLRDIEHLLATISDRIRRRGQLATGGLFLDAEREALERALLRLTRIELEPDRERARRLTGELSFTLEIDAALRGAKR